MAVKSGKVIPLCILTGEEKLNGGVWYRMYDNSLNEGKELRPLYA